MAVPHEVGARPSLGEHPPGAPARDPARTTLAVVFIAGMLVLSFWVISPFLTAAVWAATIVIATWPLMLWVERRLWNRRGLAAAVMTVVLLLSLILPLAFALATIAAHAQDIIGWIHGLAQWTAPEPPRWLEGLPVIGQRAAARWHEAAALTREEIAGRLSPYSGQIVSWAVGTVGSIGMVFLQLLLVVISAAILYACGDTAAAGVRRFARRIAGAQGESSVRLAGQAIRGVALGIILTAIIQTVLAGIGLAVAGAPFAAVLTAIVFVLCIAQIGAVLPLLLAVAWVYWSGAHTWAIALLIWTVVVCGIDNVLRPVLIRRGADLPLLLVFVGVIGGLLAYGMIGIFLGPVVLAVGYTLLQSWVATGEPGAAAPAGETAAATARPA